MHCRPRIAGADLFTEDYLPASSFSSGAGTEGAAKSLVCVYITSSSSFVLLLLEFVELIVPERDQASVKGSRKKSLFHAQVDGVPRRVNKGIEDVWRRRRDAVRISSSLENNGRESRDMVNLGAGALGIWAMEK